MQKEKLLENDGILVKAIEEKKICIKIEFKVFANFAVIKLHSKPQKE